MLSYEVEWSASVFQNFLGQEHSNITHAETKMHSFKVCNLKHYADCCLNLVMTYNLDKLSLASARQVYTQLV